MNSCGLSSRYRTVLCWSVTAWPASFMNRGPSFRLDPGKRRFDTVCIQTPVWRYVGRSRPSGICSHAALTVVYGLDDTIHASISAKFGQLPCLDVAWISCLIAKARARVGGKISANDWMACVSRLSNISTLRYASRERVMSFLSIQRAQCLQIRVSPAVSRQRPVSGSISKNNWATP